MKIKYSLIPFVPFALFTIVLKIMSLFSADSNGLLFGMNQTSIIYLAIGAAIGLFAVCILINIFDRKTAPVYGVKKNIFSGIFAILSGVTILISSVANLMSQPSDSSDYYFITMIVAVLSVPAAAALIFMSKVHFTGESTVSGISMIYIFPTLWACCGLVSEFLTATKTSISTNDMTPLFCYIFITLYFFSHSMIISRIKGRNPVKSSFTYGLPAVAISLAYGIFLIFTVVKENSLADQLSYLFQNGLVSLSECTAVKQLLAGTQFIIVSVYIISFIVEMFFGTLSKDEVEIVDRLPEDDDAYAKSYLSSGAYDEILVSEKNRPEENKDSGIPVSAALNGLDDFVIGYVETEDDIKYSSAAPKDFDDMILNTSDDSYPDLAEDIMAKAQPEPETEPKKAAKSIFGFKSDKKEKNDKKSDIKNSDADNSKDKKPAQTQFRGEKKSEPQHQASDDKKSEPRNDIPDIIIDSTRERVDEDRLGAIDRLLQELENKK